MPREVEYVDVSFDRLENYTDSAYLFVFDDGEKHWVPRSLVYNVDEDEDVVTMALWKAEELGLV